MSVTVLRDAIKLQLDAQLGTLSDPTQDGDRLKIAQAFADAIDPHFLHAAEAGSPASSTTLGIVKTDVDPTGDPVVYLKPSVDSLLAGKADVGHNHDASYLKLTGGTVNGVLLVNTQSGAQPFGVTRQGATSQAFEVWVEDREVVLRYTEDETTPGYWRFRSRTSDGLQEITWLSVNPSGVVVFDQTPQVGSSVIWHAGNLDPNSFATSGHNHDSKYLKLTGGTLTGYTEVQADFRIGKLSDPNTGTLPGYGNKLYFSGGPAGSTWDSDNSDPIWMARYNVATDQSELRVNVGDALGSSDRFVVGTHVSGTWTPMLTVDMAGGLWAGDYGSNKIWHAGNDGAGSGLDADTIDGQHASAFAAASHTHPWSQISSTPTTLAGYGITDAASASHGHTVVDPLTTQEPETDRNVHATGVYSFRTMSTTVNKPGGMDYTAVIGFGRGASGSAQFAVGWTSGFEGNVYVRSLRDTTDSWWPWRKVYTERTPPTFAEIASKPTTIAGFGITDAYTKTEADGRYLQLSGGTLIGALTINAGSAATALDLKNGNIIGVNHLKFNNPGPNEGIEWAAGNGWKIYESPNDLTTQASGNLQIAQGSTRRATFNTSGQLEIPVGTGTAPFVISSTTVVSNLNADLLDGQHASAFAAASHTHDASAITSGTLSTSRIPNLDASKITSGTLSISRIPTGTSSSTVALGNHTHSDYAQRQYHSASISTAGWYRIASNGPVSDGGTGGSRAHATFTVRDTTSGRHGSITFIASVHYGKSPTLTLLSRSWYSTHSVIKDIRIVHGDTYEGAAVEVYIEPVSGSSAEVNYTIYDNEQFSGWTPVDWTAGSVPTGFSTTTLDLDSLDVVMGAAADTVQIWSLGRDGRTHLTTAGAYPLVLTRLANNGEVGIEFHDNTQNTQTGYLTFTHVDSSSNSKGASFHFKTTEASLAVIIDGSGDYYVGTNKVWHQGNDGGGSGLDADLLDGLHASSFARAGARTDNYVWVRRSSTSSALYVTNQSTGNIAEFYSGSGDGTRRAYITNGGSFYAPSFYETSSRSLKKDIEDYRGNAIELIRGVRIRIFAFKNEPTVRRIGIVAEETDPTFTGPKRDGFSLPDSLAVTMRAVQQLAEENEQLKKENADLRTQVATITELVHQLVGRLEALEARL